MRKTNLLLLATILLIYSVSAFGQDDKNRGVRAGWQNSNYYEDGNNSGDNLSAFYIGVTGEKSILPLLKFGSGFEYFQNGISGSIGNDEYKFKAHTISIPIYLKLKLGPVFALGGAGANFTITQQYKLNDNSVDVPDAAKTNWFDVPVFAGIGVKILIVTIEARYHWGMLDASSSDLTNPQVQYFQIGAGISF